MRVHILGASGSGVTSLGGALSRATGCAHLDTDDFYWFPTEAPFTVKRTFEERLKLLNQAFERAAETGWVLSGSLMGWGDVLMPLFELAVYLSAPVNVRIERLRARETTRFGEEAVAPGGSRHADYVEFLDWAAAYDEGSREGRSRQRHEAWLSRLPCAVLRLDGTEPLDALVQQILNAL